MEKTKKRKSVDASAMGAKRQSDYQAREAQNPASKIDGQIKKVFGTAKPTSPRG